MLVADSLSNDVNNFRLALSARRRVHAVTTQPRDDKSSSAEEGPAVKTSAKERRVGESRVILAPIEGQK